MKTVSYTEVWQRHGSAYRRMLDAAEQAMRRAIEVYAQKSRDNEQTEITHSTITREHGDAPEVTLRWQGSDGLNRSVQVLVGHAHEAGDGNDLEYEMTVSAWYDDTTRNRRSWWQQPFGPPVGLDGLSEQIPDAINAARRLSRADLTLVDALPELPPGLSQEQRDRLMAQVAAERTWSQ